MTSRHAEGVSRPAPDRRQTLPGQDQHTVRWLSNTLAPARGSRPPVAWKNYSFWTIHSHNSLQKWTRGAKIATHRWWHPTRPPCNLQPTWNPLVQLSQTTMSWSIAIKGSWFLKMGTQKIMWFGRWIGVCPRTMELCRRGTGPRQETRCGRRPGETWPPSPGSSAQWLCPCSAPPFSYVLVRLLFCFALIRKWCRLVIRHLLKYVLEPSVPSWKEPNHMRVETPAPVPFWSFSLFPLDF